jgi:hypothetical protein
MCEGQSSILGPKLTGLNMTPLLAPVLDTQIDENFFQIKGERFFTLLIFFSNQKKIWGKKSVPQKFVFDWFFVFLWKALWEKRRKNQFLFFFQRLLPSTSSRTKQELSEREKVPSMEAMRTFTAADFPTAPAPLPFSGGITDDFRLRMQNLPVDQQIHSGD